MQVVVSKVPNDHLHVVATGKRPLHTGGAMAKGQGDRKVCSKFRPTHDLTCSGLTSRYRVVNYQFRKGKKIEILVKQGRGIHGEHEDNKPDSTVSVFHPGNIWKCDICTETSTHAALVKHLQQQHQIRINEYKCTYGFSSDSALSVATHKRYCQGNAPQDKEHKCPYCKFPSETENGLKVHTSRANSDIHDATLKEKKVFAWTEAQLDFLAELVIDLKAKETPKLNMQLAKMMDRGEKAIQKIRTKAEYKHAEARARQRLKESKRETDIKSNDSPTNNLTDDRTPSSMTSSADVDFHIESNQCTPQVRQIKIYRKLFDLGNLSIAKNTPLTSKLLLDTSTIALVHNNSTPTHGTQNRRSSVNRTPRVLPKTPSFKQPTPTTSRTPNAHILKYSKGEIKIKRHRRLPEIP